MSLDFAASIRERSLTFIPLRLIVGYGFMEHGFAKLAKGPDAFRYPPSIRRARPAFSGMVYHPGRNARRFSCNSGAFVTLASLPMAAVLLVTGVAALHLPYGFSAIKLIAGLGLRPARLGPPGSEFNLLSLLRSPSFGWSWTPGNR